jgi:hypothetical protein
MCMLENLIINNNVYIIRGDVFFIMYCLKCTYLIRNVSSCSCMGRQTNAVQGLTFSGFRIQAYRHLVGHLGRGISRSQGLCLHRITEAWKRRIYLFISRVGFEPTIPVVESSRVEKITRFRPRSHCNWPCEFL